MKLQPQKTLPEILAIEPVQTVPDNCPTSTIASLGPEHRKQSLPQRITTDVKGLLAIPRILQS